MLYFKHYLAYSWNCSQERMNLTWWKVMGNKIPRASICFGFWLVWSWFSWQQVAAVFCNLENIIPYSSSLGTPTLCSPAHIHQNQLFPYHTKNLPMVTISLTSIKPMWYLLANTICPSQLCFEWFCLLTIQLSIAQSWQKYTVHSFRNIRLSR